MNINISEERKRWIVDRFMIGLFGLVAGAVVMIGASTISDVFAVVGISMLSTAAVVFLALAGWLMVAESGEK